MFIIFPKLNLVITWGEGGEGSGDTKSWVQKKKSEKRASELKREREKFLVPC